VKAKKAAEGKNDLGEEHRGQTLAWYPAASDSGDQ